jgi:hypothetical protein
MPHIRNLGKYGKPTYDQATKIIKRFGGEVAMAQLIGVSRVTVYRWNYRRPLGSDGLVPTRQINLIKSLARANGVLVQPEDWVPRIARYDGETILAPGQSGRKVINRPTRPVLADLLA